MARAQIARQLSEHSGALFAFLARGWASFAGLVLVLLATTRLDAAEQGYFFTFQTLLQFQFLLELGFAVVLTQYVSHEWAHLHVEGGHVEGDPAARARLAGLIRLARRWYLGVSVGFLVIAAPAGAGFFAWRGEAGVDWLLPWLALCGAQAIAIHYTPLPSMLEGTGDVARSQRSLLTANIVAALGTWAALLGGAGLWAAPVQVGLRALVALALLLPATRVLRHIPVAAEEIRAHEPEWRDAFRRQQIRIAASWAAGLLMFQSFTPIAFAVRGAVVAGQVGVLVQAFHAVNQLASAWLTAAQPQMGRLGSLGRIEELRHLVRVTLSRSLGTALLLASASFAALGLLEWLRPEYAERFGSLWMAAGFLTAAVVLQVTNVWTAVVRFQRQEPFVMVMWVSSALVAASNLILGSLWGGTGIALGFLVVFAVVVAPWVGYVKRQYV
ncbi:MAG: hypothetical protein KC472_04780 [Dehalococcoidia bacterium]|nr:hypothetical protein [Dehalococcoidia bacterium]